MRGDEPTNRVEIRLIEGIQRHRTRADRVCLRRFENHRQPREARIVDEPPERLQPDAAVSELLVAIHTAPERLLRVIQMEDGESIDDFRERLKKSAAPKKSSISADMLDTANTYDDKVALIRLLVAEDSGRVANVLKTMIRLDNPV